MKKAQATKYFGSQVALARALGIGKSSVSEWGDTIPLLRQCQIEVITSGKLKADRTVVKLKEPLSD